MSTSGSTQWIESPWMPSTGAENIYSTQLQSPLFRLPRELRYKIYERYADARRSYEYNKETNQLRYTDECARTENLGLMVTCKIAAEEMRQVAFQKAEFSTRCSAYDGPEFMGLRSKAARLHYSKLDGRYHHLGVLLIEYRHLVMNMIQTQRQRMLVCVAELLKALDFADIEARYPEMGIFLGDELPQAVAQQNDLLRLSMPRIRGDDSLYQACIDALLFALVRAKNSQS